MIVSCINAIATITGYLFWLCAILAVIFSLIFNKISDKEREKREHGRVELHEDIDTDSCTKPVHIVRSRGGSR